MVPPLQSHIPFSYRLTPWYFSASKLKLTVCVRVRVLAPGIYEEATEAKEMELISMCFPRGAQDKKSPPRALHSQSKHIF